MIFTRIKGWLKIGGGGAVLNFKVTSQNANMQENSSQNATFVLNRLKNLLEIKTDAELAEFLNIKANTLSTWKSRNSVDYEAIIAVCELYEIDLNHLFLNKSVSKTHANEGLALISKELQLTYTTEQNREEVLSNAKKIQVPGFSHGNARAFEVVSNNMFPIIEENSIAICELTSFKLVQEKEVVLLASKTKGIFVGYFTFLAESSGMLSFENEMATPIYFNSEDDCEFWRLKAVLQYDFSASRRIQVLAENFNHIKSL